MDNSHSHQLAVHQIRYSDEVKRAAVIRLQNGETYKQVAADVGCHISNLNLWKAKAEGRAQAPSYTNRSATPHAHRACPNCAELRAIIKLVVETANASPTIRAGVLRIAVDAIATPSSAANSDASAS